MDSKSPIEMFFFPYVGGGHQIPMIDIARVFASHGAKATIITTPKHSIPFQKLIDRDQKSGLQISIHTLNLPDNVDISDVDMTATPRTDTSMLKEPLKNLLIDYQPDCIVHDMFHRWSADVINSVGTPRIGFNGNCCFARCVRENMGKYKPHEKVGSDFEPFFIPGLPDRIELTRSQLPSIERQPQPHGSFPRGMPKPDENSFGTVVNSFYELEPAYVEYFKNEIGNKSWLVGPVSLCNKNVVDKAERGQKTALDEQSILSWLECKEPDSVLYISFGSKPRLAPEQILEIAHGLEASNHPFIWVVGSIFKSAGKEKENEENWFPSGFDERMKQSQKGLIIRGWAPQLLILEHTAVGGFMTHCGWNSTLEGVSAGLPMITWPISAEQFSNEKLVVDVLKIGVKVGSMNWVSWDMEPWAAVGREKVETAVKKLLGGGEDVAEMRRRAKELGEKAKGAVEEGGSSYKDADALIEELKSRRKS